MQSEAKNVTCATLKLSSNMIGGNGTDFLHKLLLSDRGVSNLHKCFA